MLFLLCLLAIALTVWNRASVNELHRSISELQKEFAILRRAAGGAEIALAAAPAVAPAPAPETTFFEASVARKPAAPPRSESIFVEDMPPIEHSLEEALVAHADRPSEPVLTAPEHVPEPNATIGTAAHLERQFGARLPVWIGGVALALAGFFLVRYTIEIGLLTETVRVVLGGLFGITLIAAGRWATRKTSLASGERIGQALLGAGIADLYASLFMATTLYHLLSPTVGFVGMAAVTVGAVVLSLRHGAPIAVLGLVGGFLTPLMTGSTEPNVPLLFGYLYCLVAGFLAVIRKQSWWLLAVPTVLAGFGWVILSIANGLGPRGIIWPLLYVIAISATVVLVSHGHETDEPDEPIDLASPMAMLRYISLGTGIVLSGSLSGLAGFEPIEWSLFGLLTIGAIALAAFRPRIYAFGPIAALTMSFAMFVAWGESDPLTFGITIVAFGLIHCVSGSLLMWRSPTKAMWGTLIAAAALGYYLLAYMSLHEVLAEQWQGVPVWGAIGFGLALGSAWLAAGVLKTLKGEPAQPWLLFAFSAAAACFVTIGLAIELPRQSLYVAVSAEVLAAVWIATRVQVRALEPIPIALLGLFGLLVLPELSFFLQLALPAAGNASWIYTNAPAIDWPILRLGIPALMFVGASVLLRGRQDQTFAHGLEAVAAALVAATIYCITRQAFHPDGNALLAEAGEIERSVITNVFFLAGLAALWLGHRFQRGVAVCAAAAFAVIGLFRILPEFGFLLQLALWSLDNQIPYGRYVPAINWPVLQFALPALLFLAANLISRGGKYEASTPVLESATAVLLGAAIYCLTRQLFHPEANAVVAAASFMERGVITNIFFLSGLGAFWLGRRFQRGVWTSSGVAFSAIALFRIAYFDLFALNPVWSHQFVGDLPLINWLVLPFGLCIAWTVMASREMRALGRRDVVAGLSGFAFVLLFALVTLNVRQLYWGGYLDGGRTVDSEVYAYSAAWLLLGVGLLIAGTIMKQQMIRIASLVTLLVAIGKVFLIDASSLEGLYRVVSFFGLGVTLIALSWFYTRYVFVDKDGAPATTPPRTARSAR